MLPEAPRMSATPAHADPAALRARLAALPGVSVRDTDHAALGYDLEVRVPATAVPEAVGLLDAAGDFLEGMTGVDWLGERETLLKEAKAKAAAAAKAAADAEAAADGAATAPAAAPQEAAPGIPEEDELEVVYDCNRYAARHRVSVRVRVPRSAPQLPAIAQIYPIAHWHEREIHEFFGIVFTGHPYLVPLLLPEDADYHPLLKDYGA